MDYIKRVRKTDLARNTRQVIRNAQRGQTILIENHGQAEAAILDILDYRILRAFMAYHAHQPAVDPDGIPDQKLSGLKESQDIFNLVLAYYLGGAISLGRAAELLDLPALDLQARFQRLEVPIQLGPEDAQAALDEIRTAREH